MKKIVSFLCLFFCLNGLKSQNSVFDNGQLKFKFNQEGTHYVRLTFLNQVWFRYMETNPGTTVFGTPKNEIFDIGLRRTRIQLFGQITDRLFFYTQFGQNNLGAHSARKQGIFFLDGLTEYKVAKDYFSIGGGLSGWNGLSRYASPSVGSPLSLDVPLYQQSTNDLNDQFLRKLSIYAKGKLGKLDYRLAVVNPMAMQNSTAQSATITQNASFAYDPAEMQLEGYLMFQFLDKEANTTPYNVGSYLGKKRVFNIGAGFVSQQDAMWYLSDDGKDTLKSNLGLFAIDLFYDTPLNAEKGNAITAYACFSVSDFGKNYVRNIEVMNPANGVNSLGSFNGAGNALPLIGTGNTLFLQVGYLFKSDLLGDKGTLQPYANIQYSQFQLLKDPMMLYEGGVNWIMENQRAKLSLNYQSRPVYFMNTLEEYRVTARKGMLVLQFQIAI